MPKALDNFTWPSTPGGPVLTEDYEDDFTEYDIQHTEQQLEFGFYKTNKLSTGEEVPK